jgi:hypothetical protein
MNDADYEAELRYERRQRERKAGLEFTQMLRERLEDGLIPIEDLMESEGPKQPEELGARGPWEHNWRPL